MRVVGLVGVLGLLGGLRATEASDSGESPKSQYKTIQKHANQLARVMEHVYKPGMEEEFLEEYEKGMSEAAVDIYEKMVKTYEEMRKKVLEFGEAAGNAECSFEERKRLAMEVADKSIEVMGLKVRLSMECRFSEETLKYLDGLHSSYHNSLMWNLRNPRNDSSGFLFNIYND